LRHGCGGGAKKMCVCVCVLVGGEGKSDSLPREAYGSGGEVIRFKRLGTTSSFDMCK
jgi:hypothetical protein